jgi:purine nucleoside phosphorylase
MDNSFESIQTAAAGLRSILPAGFQPSVGIICGSGLSGIADAVEPITDGMRDEVSYGEIKGFPVSAGRSGLYYL